MQIFAQQLRELMGVVPLHISSQVRTSNCDYNSWKIGNVVVEDDPAHGITGWELDRLYRIKSVQNAMDTISTLSSLSSLLSSLGTIVVRDHIADLVQHSLDALEQIRVKLERDLDIGEAAIQARLAIGYAEKAFFDPSMVSLLYFPAQHLLAVYVSELKAI